MSTRYTAGVASGEIKTFEEYALQCARAFGACILLRDEPLSSEIPEFEPSDYHSKELKKASKELKLMLEGSDKEVRALYEKEMAEKAKRVRDSLAKTKLEIDRYKSMLEKALAFVPPTEDHKGLADFMVKQLQESIRFDDMSSYCEKELVTPPFELWKRNKIDGLMKSISRDKEEYQKEVERTNTRNKWVRDLKRSLGMQELQKEPAK